MIIERQIKIPVNKNILYLLIKNFIFDIINIKFHETRRTNKFTKSIEQRPSTLKRMPFITSANWLEVPLEPG